MLLRLHESVECGMMPSITKYVNGEDASVKGAFSLDTEIEISVECPRTLGVSAVVMRINKDGEPSRDLTLKFADSDLGRDKYSLTLKLDKEFCGGDDGLFYYEFLFLRGYETLFSSSINNVDFELCEHSSDKFRLLVYAPDYTTPEWFHGGTMYQIFTDRFFKGNGKVGVRGDIVNGEWDTGVKQYAEYPGAPVANNEFFGGNLWGIAEKLDYLKSLGVTVIYLNPIFEAYSSHKYDTGDYMKVDPMFGGEEALENLISKAKEKGIRIILDGVFNHTGNDSRYFKRYGKYDSEGAYQSRDSDYKDWYFFKEYPDSYECWWNIEILPKLNLGCTACRDFLCNKGGVAEKYMKMGVDGWRLDVADELGDDFLDILRETVKGASGGEGIIIGEVWENAADKIAYGKRRRYFRGKQLDSVMNYPIRNGILAFVTEGDAETFYNILTELYSSYPETVCHSLMNSLGTHDTERILSVLGDEEVFELTNKELSTHKMTDSQREKAVSRLKIASALQYTVFGVPSIYYGDEAGLEGGHDPFCRQPFPWGSEDKELTEHYRKLGDIRKEHTAFTNGKFKTVSHQKGFIAYERYNEDENILVVANVGKSSKGCSIGCEVVDLLTGKTYKDTLSVAPGTAMILKLV